MPSPWCGVGALGTAWHPDGDPALLDLPSPLSRAGAGQDQAPGAVTPGPEPWFHEVMLIYAALEPMAMARGFNCFTLSISSSSLSFPIVILPLPPPPSPANPEPQ